MDVCLQLEFHSPVSKTTHLNSSIVCAEVPYICWNVTLTPNPEPQALCTTYTLCTWRTSSMCQTDLMLAPTRKTVRLEKDLPILLFVAREAGEGGRLSELRLRLTLKIPSHMAFADWNTVYSPFLRYEVSSGHAESSIYTVWPPFE